MTPKRKQINLDVVPNKRKKNEKESTSLSAASKKNKGKEIVPENVPEFESLIMTMTLKMLITSQMKRIVMKKILKQKK